MNPEQTTLSQLLDTALDLPPEKRDSWIESLGEEHAPLKPRLRTLLARAAGIETSDFLNTLPKMDLGEASATGEQIGPYTLIREIGKGGMGSVWLAERTDGGLKRPVALKFLRAFGPHEAFAERLQRERDILAALVHPGIARLYDAGISRNRLPYLALEYIEGEHIDACCRTRHLDIRARVSLVLQVARAVAHAHGKLVVHRDLKPANVLVSEDGQAHLLDFGIAKLLEDGRTVETKLTQMSGQALTPEYASPEQILGQAVTTASDVYSLGVILYEVLTDTRPYRLKRESRGALEEAILEADPERPSDRVGRSPFARALRGDLDAIVLKALKKQPDQRYTTMDAFAEDLYRYLHGHPVRARPDSAWYRFRKFVNRNRFATASATAVFVAVVAGAAVALWQARVAVAEQQRAEQVKDFIASIFGEANPFIGPQDSPTAVELLNRARDRVERLQNLHPATRIELLCVLGESFEGIGANAEAAQIADLAVSGAAALGPAHPLTIRAHRLRAEVFRDQGDTDAMRKEMDIVLAVLRPQADARPVESVHALETLAHNQLDAAQYADADRTVKEAMALAEKHRAEWTLRDWELEQAELWRILASTREALADFGPALEAAEKALAFTQAAYRDQPKHPTIINMRLIFARLAAHANMPQAIAMMQQSIADAAEVFGPDHRTIGLYSQNLAVWQVRVGDLKSATTSIERARPILENTYGADSTHMAAWFDAAAFLALNSRAAQRAIELYDQGIAIAEKHLPPGSEPPVIMRMRRSLARAYLAQPRSIDEAIGELQEILEVFDANHFSAPSRAYLALGEAQRLAGDFRSALANQRKGMSLIVESPNADRERMAFLTEIGLDQVGLGENDSAAESLERALALIEKHQTHLTPLRADALLGLGQAQLALGRNEQALRQFAAAAAFWKQFDPASRWAEVTRQSIARAQGARW